MITKYRNVLIAIALGLLLGAAAGFTFTSKWYQAAETDRVRTALKLADQEKAAALAALKTYYESKPPVEVIKTEVEQVIKYVSTSRDCDVSPREQRLLDYTRTGLQPPSGGVDESSGGSETIKADQRIPRVVEVRAHVDAALNYRQCYAAAKAVEQYLKQRVVN